MLRAGWACSGVIHSYFHYDIRGCSMTSGAQQALRRTMEIYSNTTRFALACNQSSKIIEPIQSRCAVVRYSRLSDQELLARVLEICRMEKVSTTCLAHLASLSCWLDSCELDPTRNALDRFCPLQSLVAELHISCLWHRNAAYGSLPVPSVISSFPLIWIPATTTAACGCVAGHPDASRITSMAAIC